MEKLPVILDREINDPSLDAFGHRHYAIALKHIVENNKPPFSVGLLGNWGVGKSTIKELYLHELQDDLDRKKAVLPITFNAWRYGGENVKRALLRHVYITLGGREDELKDKMYHQISEVVLKPRAWKEIISEFYQRYLWYPSQMIFITLVIVFLFSYFSKGVNDPLIQAGLGAVLSIVFTAIARFALSANGMVIPRYSNVTKVYPPTVNTEQYADFLIEQLHVFKKSTDGKLVDRIIVFVDDLDRLSSEEMIEGLDAVRIFMEIPKEKLPEQLGIVFVLSCDEEKISYALSNKRNSEYLPASVSNKKDARRYLDRIFQFRLEILPFPKRDLRTYAQEKLLSAMPEFRKELESKGIQLSNIVDRLIHPAVQSPRNALQLVNMFMQSWWIAKKREFEGSNTNITGGLSEGNVTNHPEALAVVCALRVDFHYFYEDLLEDHNLVDAFTRTFIHNLNDGYNLSERSKRILGRYREEGEENEKYKLKEEYYSLRQYLRYVQGIRLPNYLQPIILLSQDKVSRKIGNNRLVYESLINGDSTAIFDEFSLSIDPTKTLPIEFMGAVNEIIEDLQNETDLYIINSSITLGEISSKFPVENFYTAIGFLCNSLINFPDIRWKLGLDNINEIYDRASTDQKAIITDIFIDEFIKTEDVITFKLKSGQFPTIEELTEIINTAVEMILKAKFIDNVRFKGESRFFAWLKLRRYSNNRKEDNVSYTILENWVEKYPELLEKIGIDYLDEGIRKLGQGTELNNSKFVESFNLVVNREWLLGEESKNKIWLLLTKGIKVKQEYISMCVLEQVTNKLIFSSEMQYNDFLYSVLERVISHEKNQEEWALNNYEKFIALIIELIQVPFQIFDDNYDLIAELTDYWKNREGKAQFTIQFANIIRMKDEYQFNKILKKIIGLLPNEVHEDYIKYIGDNYLNLSIENQKLVVDYYNGLTTTTSIDNEMVRSFGVLLKKIDYEATQESNLNILLSSLFSRLHEWSNYNEYTTKLLPSISHLIGFTNISNIGFAIQTLFTSSTTMNNFEVYNILSSSMIDKMPKESNALSPYDPEEIFNSAHSVISRAYNYNNLNMIHALELINSMVKSAVISNDYDEKVMELALLYWENGYKEETKEIIANNTFLPTKEQYYQIISSTNTGELSERKVLQGLLDKLSSHVENEMFIAVSLDIIKELSRDVIEMWVKANSGKEELLIEILKNGGLNNEQLKIVTLMILKRLKPENQKLVHNLIHESIAIFEKEKEKDGAFKVIFERRNNINNLFLEESMINLYETLLLCLIKTSSISLKRSFADWLFETKAGLFLRNIGKYKTNNVDIEILLEVFKNSRSLKKMYNSKEGA
ncbi:KAP family P-loop NTPase fold protein [Paenibacillus agilis]|uniref:KAP NTPase domain-containing protein n=1 Tax=Paenibacillus agilis TaxID=3020863 RepID=A0A559IWP3_9BACL|nr:P-loop NTPase fold protein [Paenibacillus agilis]TVX92047.1 hypothetical protein FPZ44_02640 [Paenibacillus agilis]